MTFDLSSEETLIRQTTQDDSDTTISVLPRWESSVGLCDTVVIN